MVGQVGQGSYKLYIRGHGARPSPGWKEVPERSRQDLLGTCFRVGNRGFQRSSASTPGLQWFVALGFSGLGPSEGTVAVLKAWVAVMLGKALGSNGRGAGGLLRWAFGVAAGGFWGSTGCCGCLC